LKLLTKRMKTARNGFVLTAATESTDAGQKNKKTHRTGIVLIHLFSSGVRVYEKNRSG